MTLRACSEEFRTEANAWHSGRHAEAGGHSTEYLTSMYFYHRRTIELAFADTSH